MSYGQWCGPRGFPKAGNTGVWAGTTVVGGQHRLCPVRGWGHRSRLQAHLKTARWVCSCSSPLITQENNPKDSAPGDEGRGGHLSVEGSAPHQGMDIKPNRLLMLLGDGSAQTKPRGATQEKGTARPAALVPSGLRWDHDLPAPPRTAVTASVTRTAGPATPQEALPAGACH